MAVRTAHEAVPARLRTGKNCRVPRRRIGSSRSGAPRASRPTVIASHEDDLRRLGRDAVAGFASTFGAGAAPGDGQDGLRVWGKRLRGEDERSGRARPRSLTN